MLSSGPQTPLMLLAMGWFITSPGLKRSAERSRPFVPRARREPIAAMARQSVEPSGH